MNYLLHTGTNQVAHKQQSKKQITFCLIAKSRLERRRGNPVEDQDRKNFRLCIVCFPEETLPPPDPRGEPIYGTKGTIIRYE